ncbi:hypothetical protein [Jiella marina]|uniref:hypothetical protein n=1 Tax=Jiella sp. LLJ827 TaxID=2917712 RepID=UPI002101D3D1|nr:hypothetical protein [Jiella sp. LLJ827]MCQ0986192.1 hypothetical protein [Jiella sp. LLJ827]
MNENVENLVLEHMRAMRSQMARMEEKLDTLSAEMLIMRQHVGGLVGSQTLNDQRFATMEARLDRIERRLELVD